MNFVSGFLALCSVVGPGTATEIAGSGYARQAISFSNAVNGVSVSSRGYDFGNVGVESNVVGRAIFDAPLGGNLLAVLPHAAPRPPQGGSIDRGEAGYLTLIVTALAAYPDGGAFSGNFAAGATLGVAYDGDEVIGWASTMPNPASGVTILPRGGQFLRVRASILTGGVALAVASGVLSG
jgi:hypothetical protein